MPIILPKYAVFRPKLRLSALVSSLECDRGGAGCSLGSQRSQARGRGTLFWGNNVWRGVRKICKLCKGVILRVFTSFKKKIARIFLQPRLRQHTPRKIMWWQLKIKPLTQCKNPLGALIADQVQLPPSLEVPTDAVWNRQPGMGKIP